MPTPPQIVERCFSVPGYRYVSRLRRDALQPRANCREVLENEAPLVSDVGVGVEGDVRYRVTPPDEELPAFQVLLHDPERVVAELLFDLEGTPAFFGHLRVEDVEPGAGHGDVWLVVVLLEEHPPQRLRPVKPAGRQKRGAFGEVEQDRVGFRQELSRF